jgi:hypothetical protein
MGWDGNEKGGRVCGCDGMNRRGGGGGGEQGEAARRSSEVEHVLVITFVRVRY